jgi:hypothetical protein
MTFGAMTLFTCTACTSHRQRLGSRAMPLEWTSSGSRRQFMMGCSAATRNARPTRIKTSSQITKFQRLGVRSHAGAVGGRRGGQSSSNKGDTRPVETVSKRSSGFHHE